MGNKLLFLDTETTGKDPEDRLIQLAYKFQGEPGTELKFKPPVPIKFEAMATHHITEKMLENLTSFSDGDFKAAFQATLKDNIMVAHNATFDKEILEREGLIVHSYIDTLKVAQVYLDEPSYKLQVLRYKYNFDIEATAHDAMGDVLVLEKLFDFLYKKIADEEVNEFLFIIGKMIQITSQPILLRRIGFGKHKGTEFSKIPKDYLTWLKKQPDNDADLVFTINHYLKPEAKTTQPTLGV